MKVEVVALIAIAAWVLLKKAQTGATGGGSICPQGQIQTDECFVAPCPCVPIS